MRNFITSLFVFVCFASQVYGQWQPNGATTGNIYYNNGNVGLGTTSPGYKLHVVTTNSLDGLQLNNNNQNWLSLFSPSMTQNAFNNITHAGDAGVIFGSASGINTVNYGFVIAPHRSSTSGLRVDENGNIGIGTATSGAKLQINSGSGKISVGDMNWQSSPALGYANGYAGFNMQNTSTANWLFSTDGANNGGSGFYTDIFGQMKFVSVGSSGSADQTLTNADLASKVVLTLSPGASTTTGRARVNSGSSELVVNKIPWQSESTLGYAKSYIGFNIEDDGANAWQIATDGVNNGGVAIMGDIFGGLKFINVASIGGGSPRSIPTADLSNNIAFRIAPGYIQAPGIVTIGQKATPTGYKLSIDGKMITEEVNVQLKNSWPPDYVFEKDYNLLPLSEVDSYIKQNKHLPEVPSAKEMEQDGLNLKEMNLLLLKKVEELTLHVIELKKENVELKRETSEISQLKKEIEDLQKRFK